MTTTKPKKSTKPTKPQTIVAKKPSRLATVRIPTYSLAEELVNSISHGIGAGLAIVALILCVVKADTAISIVSVALYGAIMIILYTISCIYHALSPKVVGKKVLRIIDHCNVLLMVAGTYLPVCLSLIGGALGWVLFGIVWGITIPVVILNCINVDKYSNLSVACNLVLGWGALLILGPLKEHCDWAGIWLLIAGGFTYTVGSIIYNLGAKHRWFHSIFHFFVLGGGILHFFFIYLFCI